MKNFENKIITTSDGGKYLIISELIVDGKLFIIGNEVNEKDELAEDVYVFRVDNSEEKLNIILETDLVLLEKVLNQAATSLEE